MILLLIIGLLLAGATVALAARAIALPRLRAEERVGQIGSYGFPVVDLDERASGPLSAALDRLAERVGSAVLPRLGREDADEVRVLLSSAGIYSMTPGRFLGYRAIGAVGLVGAVAVDRSVRRSGSAGGGGRSADGRRRLGPAAHPAAHARAAAK